MDKFIKRHFAIIDASIKSVNRYHKLLTEGYITLEEYSMQVCCIKTKAEILRAKNLLKQLEKGL